nr:ATP-binding protein [uncultured Desulfobulbus sp.]
MKLQTRATLAFSLIALFCCLVTGVFISQKTLKSHREQAISFLTSINIQKKARIEQWLVNASNTLDLLASMPVFHDNFSQKLAQKEQQGIKEKQIFLQELTTLHLAPVVAQNLFTEIFILLVPQGEVLLSTDSHQVGKLMVNRDFFTRGQKQNYIENVHYSMTLMQPSMLISTPLKNGGDSSYGVLVGRLNLAKLSAIVEEHNSFWTTEDSYLVNNQNFFITEPRYGQEYMLRKTVHTHGVTEVLSGHSGASIYNDYRDVTVIGSYLYLAERNLGLLTKIDQEEFLAPNQQIQRQLVGIGFAVLLLTFFISWFFAQTLLRPLGHLVDKLNRVSGENLEYSVSSSGLYEIQQISVAFMTMLVRLKETLVSRNMLQREVEQRKSAEQQLQHALERVKQSNTELEQFAYVASHDLQEPLRMVSSYNQLLAQKYKGQLDEKADKYIHFAVDGAARMQQLIQDLLSFSRVTTKGKEFEEVDLKEIFEITKKNLELTLEENQVEITADALPVIQADAVQITQVLQNLISNAIKFRQDEAPKIHISARDVAGVWECSVRDNGIGIDEKYADRIFIIFQRLHTREEYQGTGIGLALCKRIIERHRGKIWFESELGKGSTFYFTLPQRS